MKKFSLGALVAAGLLMGGLTAGSASAADLGGNCCADLEERIAELEATTARKGNRKVSLTVSGWVAEQVMWWDDGQEQNVYVTGLGATLASHVTFSGQATIMPGWYAGYVLHLEADENDPLFALNQDVSTGGAGLRVFQSFWFVKSDKLGKVSVGLQSPAGDNAAILVDGSGSLVPANWVLFDQAGFFMVENGVKRKNLRWGDFGFCNISANEIGGDCVSGPSQVVRYDSPVFAGFSVSADWGQDDYWDAYARYAGEWNGIKFAATSGWSEASQCGGQSPAPASVGGGSALVAGCNVTVPQNDKIGYWQSGVYIEHVATGVFVLGNYGREFIDNPLLKQPADTTLGLDDRPDHWYVKAGLRERWSNLGHTVLFGEYAQRRNMLDSNTTFATGNGEDNDPFVSSRMTQWGFGAVQEIDAAAMSVFLTYRHFDATATSREDDVKDAADNQTTKHNFDSFQLVKFGALINF